MSVVIIPAYKPDERLIGIVDQLWTYGFRIVVVDDGSGEDYLDIFNRISDVCILLRHEENRGKGAAIKTALDYVNREIWGSTLIGVMDCDGQHLPEDLLKLFVHGENSERLMILGVRNVGKDMPLKSRLGNTITRKVFKLLSGVSISDTQTGMRVFTSDLVKKLLSVEGERYEYEMNVLMFLAKEGIVLVDIYIGDITCFQTAFAQDTYGIGYMEKLTDMSARMKSILSVNGDSYSNNRHKNNGTIIRNGVIYRSQQSGEETCVLNWDGTMDIYQPGQLDEQKLIGRGAYQSWIFGPSLLDANGKANDKFWTWTYIRRSHPRTAIGYFEPGHYCLLLVDGRQQNSRGMFLDEMAKVFEDLGCKVAYNLDGGHCSFMEMNGKVVNDPYKPEHEIEDGIFITEGSL